jgi:hypothetical protein
MREVVIQIPTLETEHNIDIEVKINGKKRTMNYRVEIVEWDIEEPSSHEKVTTLRHKIKEYDKNWELIQIGSPTRTNIPIMFRKRREPAIRRETTLHE